MLVKIEFDVEKVHYRGSETWDCISRQYHSGYQEIPVKNSLDKNSTEDVLKISMSESGMLTVESVKNTVDYIDIIIRYNAPLALSMNDKQINIGSLPVPSKDVSFRELILLGEIQNYSNNLPISIIKLKSAINRLESAREFVDDSVNNVYSLGLDTVHRSVMNTKLVNAKIDIADAKSHVNSIIGFTTAMLDKSELIRNIYEYALEYSDKQDVEKEEVKEEPKQKDEKTLKRDEYVNVSSGDRSNWIDIITYASIAEQRAKEIGEIATAINTNTNQLNMDVESITARCSAIESTIRSIRDKIQMMYDITE